MRKKLVSFVIAAFVLAVSVTSVLAAHGHHNGQTRAYRSQNVNYSVCGIEDCTLTGLHTHSGKTYSSHYYGDGHDYHGYCDVANCTTTGYHEHDGAYCFGHAAGDGHNYHHTSGGHH